MTTLSISCVQLNIIKKKYYDQQINAESFAVGDRVLIYDPVNRGFSKFQKHYFGLYVVATK